ncbi:sugar transferase [Nodularia harveyana UHCC-0300]|uniref:Sugar transferase n=1 Tax=Nodularia harveyana UHCC-0300 TaxID=2974287 RepID=A0ABU5U9Q6_9CYAN|nr:sugar transferase [Nodularia harveyana]MEA5580242.1 sugar transferase [Nodularia harveyana UHCC-0300]
MDNQSIGTSKLRKAPLDLRAPAQMKVRKGLWWLRLVTLVTVDWNLLFLAWVLAQDNPLLVYSLWDDPDNSRLHIPGLVLLQIAALALQGMYNSGKKRYDYWGIIKTLSFTQVLILFICFLYQPIVDIPRTSYIFSWLMAISFVCAGRFFIDLNLEYLRRRKVLGNNLAFVISDPDNHQEVIQLVEKEKGYIISGSASARALDREHRQETLKMLEQLRITEIFIDWDAIKNRMFLCWLLQASGLTVHIIPMDLKPIYRNVEMKKIGGMTCLSFSSPVITGRDFWIKRIFDFCFTTSFLLLTFPIYIAIAIAIKLDSPGPVFFKQTRIGLSREVFQVWKFRTMRTDADKLQKELEALNETKDGVLFKIKDDPRVTRVGKFLRRYSLDELPQLFNVLLGEMSLVGPRPLPSRDVDHFSERHFIRQKVLPGVTGLWQVSGRSNILDFEQVINLDLHYIENWSLKLDFEILFRTIKVVFLKEGAY